MNESKDRLREYCILIQKLKEALNDLDYLILKLYSGYRGSKYEPQDVDIFIGNDLRKVIQIFKCITRYFPSSKAIRKGFLNPHPQIFVDGHLLEVDLYLEILFSPVFVLDRIPTDVRTVVIPWCKEIDVRSLDLPIDTFYILIHALRHKRLCNYEVLSLIDELEGFDVASLKKFVLYVRKAGLECVVALLLRLFLYYSRFILKVPIIQHPLPYCNVLRVLRILTRECNNKSMANYIVRLVQRKASVHCVGLWLIFPFYVLRSFILALKNWSKDSLKALLRVVFIYFLYEYVVALLDKLGIRK